METPIKIPRDNKSLYFLYRTVTGRIMLKFLTLRSVSKIAGIYMESAASANLINGFIKKNNIDMSEYIGEDYRCFNDFFTRRIKKKLRPIDKDPSRLIAPCDGLLSAYHIHDGLVIPIKQSEYSIEDLVQNKRVSDMYQNGTCLVFRLCVNHYHRYCYPDNGKKSINIHIDGILHTVRPIALRSRPVFTQNSREYTLIKTENFGTIMMMEIGAMLVGKIHNHHGRAGVERGEEKGYFKYGGSTIVLLIKNNKAVFDESLFESTDNNMETPVKIGEVIGYAK